MGKVRKFVYKVFEKTKENDLISMANALSYKLLLAVFPLIIFIMTLIAFLNLDTREFVADLTRDLPTEIMEIINVFMSEVVNTKRISLLSTSLLVTLFSASSGFNSLIKGLNRVYGVKLDARGVIKRRIISLILVLIFCVLIICSMYALIFSDLITEMLRGYNLLRFVPDILQSARGYIIITIAMICMIILVYKIVIDKKTPILELLPGAVFSIFTWLVLSKGFNIYINNFSKYSKVYGSIGGIFIFAIWLNLISYALLIGGQINALIYERNNDND